MANEIYDGTRVFTAAAGGTALAADQNTFQDQMILGMEARWRSIPLASGVVGDAAGWTMTWTVGGIGGAGNPDVWWSSTAANAEIIFPVHVREDEYLTGVNVWVDSSAGNPTGGTCAIYSLALNGSASAVEEEDLRTGANFWDTDATPTAQASGAITKLMEAQKQYYIGIISPAVPNGVTSYILGLEYQSRFHIGA